MMGGWFRAHDQMHCSTIQKKLLGACYGCCVKAKCVPSKAATSRCAAKRFVFTAIHLELSSLRANCAHDLNVKALTSARRRGAHKPAVIPSEAQRSRGIPQRYLKLLRRDASTSLDMTEA